PVRRVGHGRHAPHPRRRARRGERRRRHGDGVVDVSGPLAGVRIVELGVWVAGPAAGGIAADWGADVIKVEAPAGDPMRRMLAVTGGGGADLPSPPFDLDNRGKRSIVLGLDADEGRAAMHRLLATADVFLTNLRPDAVDRLGLGPDAL